MISAPLSNATATPAQQLLQQLPQRATGAEQHPPACRRREAKLQRFGVFDDADTAFLARLPYAENSIAILDWRSSSNAASPKRAQPTLPYRKS